MIDGSAVRLKAVRFTAAKAMTFLFAMPMRLMFLYYATGNDVIQEFGKGSDSLSITADNIDKVRSGNLSKTALSKAKASNYSQARRAESITAQALSQSTPQESISKARQVLKC